MNKKTLLILGATVNQLPLIVKSKERNIYTISIDNISESICHRFSDEAQIISTADKGKILEFAKKRHADGLVTSASDLALPTVSYVCNTLHLPSVLYHSVKTTVQKNLFRKFQKRNNLKTPKFFVFTDSKKVESKIEVFKAGNWVIKPVDSSGSKGIFFFDSKTVHKLPSLINKAMDYSRKKKIIIEEFIQGIHCSVDGFIYKEKIVILSITNKYLFSQHKLIPITHTIPSTLPETIQNAIKREVINILKLLHAQTTPFDFDIVITPTGEVVILEMSLRLGGNAIPRIIFYATGVDLYTLAISHAAGDDIFLPKVLPQRMFTGVFILQSPKSGLIKNLTPKNKLYAKHKPYLKELMYDYERGQYVEKFTQSNFRLGHIIIQASTEQELFLLHKQIRKDIKLVIDEKETG